jgi:hypothetical protein
MRCTIELKISEGEPNVDDLGCYFLCPRCGFRNVLRNVGKPDGPLELVQIDQ